MGVVITAISCNLLSDDRSLLLCFQVVLFSNSNQTSLNVIETLPLDVFYWLASIFWADLRCIHRKKRINSFGQRLEHLERREIFWGHRLKFLKSLNDLQYKIWTEQIHCLRNNVTDCLFVATNQSTTDQSEQTLHLDTSQLLPNQDPTVC